MDKAKDIQMLRAREAEAKGSEKRTARQHALGKFTARERLDLLLDKDTFVELGMFAQHQCHDFGMEKVRPWGDSVVTGYGKIDGKRVFVFAQDFTALGGSAGPVHINKICHIIRKAREQGAPVIGLYDSVGARIQEGPNLTGFALFMRENAITSGSVPQISVILGNCAGGSVYCPALTDFIFTVEGLSKMMITGPSVAKAAIGADVKMEDLGGTKIHNQISGVADFLAKDEAECLQMVKKLLGFIPSNYLQQPPTVDASDDPKRIDESLRDIIPENPMKAFNIYELISKIVDNGDFLEVKSTFARNIVTCFARLNGHSVGIVANQPLVLAGALDCNSSIKAARFIRFCDAFNIPLITLVDAPGYLPGVQQEQKGIIRHGAKMLYAYAEATVPKITCLLRRAYGGSYAAMCCKNLGADVVLAWPTARIALMGAEGAVNVIFRKEIDAAEAAEDKERFINEKIKEYEEIFNTPYYGASRQLIDIIFAPDETRPQLIKALEMELGKKQERPGKRHGNIPL